MKSFLVSISLLFVLTYSAYSQTRDSLLDLKKKLAVLKSVQDFEEERSGDYYKSSEPFDFDYDSLKNVRKHTLVSILKDPRSSSPQIQKELEQVAGKPISSDDGKLKIYTFREWVTINTGRYHYNIIQYTTATGITNAYVLQRKDCGYTDGFKTVSAIKGTNLYLATSRTAWCSTCNNEKAIVFKITDQYLITDYSAFSNNKSCLSIDSRASEFENVIEPLSSIEAITYNPSAKEITVRYYINYPINEEKSSEQKIDDLAAKNPFYDYPPDNNGLITVILKFDGKQFVIKQ